MHCSMRTVRCALFVCTVRCTVRCTYCWLTNCGPAITCACRYGDPRGEERCPLRGECFCITEIQSRDSNSNLHETFLRDPPGLAARIPVRGRRPELQAVVFVPAHPPGVPARKFSARAGEICMSQLFQQGRGVRQKSKRSSSSSGLVTSSSAGRHESASTHHALPPPLHPSSVLSADPARSSFDRQVNVVNIFLLRPPSSVPTTPSPPLATDAIIMAASSSPRCSTASHRPPSSPSCVLSGPEP